MTAEIVQDNLKKLHLRKLGALKNGAAGAENRRAATAFVRRFVSFVEGEWTVRRAGVAVQRLKDAVNVAADEAAKQEPRDSQGASPHAPPPQVNRLACGCED